MHTIEGLEARIAPASLTLTYTDIDGDQVKIIASKPGPTAPPLTLDDLTFTDGDPDGQLAKLNLTDPAFDGASIVFKVSKKGDGDGFAHVGFVDATEIDLKKLVVRGDLGKIRAGVFDDDGDRLELLSIRSMGEFGLTTQGGEGDLQSVISGGFDRLKIAGDFKSFLLATTLREGISSISVGGDVAGTINCFAEIRSVHIHGDLSGSVAGQEVKRVQIDGDVHGRISSSNSIISTRIKGDLTGEVRGASLGGVRVDGNVVGHEEEFSGTIRAVDHVKRIWIGGDLVGGNLTGSESLTHTGAISAGSISSVVIRGSLIAGVDSGEGKLELSGGIYALFDIGSVQIGDSIIGNETHPALIIAEYGGVPPDDGGAAISIGKVSVRNNVEFAEILAGLDGAHIPSEMDAFIGTVTVGKNWVASSIVAGARDQGAPGFGVGDTLARPEGDWIIAQIAKINIKGNVMGSAASSDAFGFVAGEVTKLMIGGREIALSPGPQSSADNFAVGSTDDVYVLEVS